MGCRTVGNPIKGFPAGRSPANPTHKRKPRREKKRQTLRLAGAVFRFGWIRSASCRNFFEIAAAGTSAGGLRAAFPSFWVAPEARRDKSFAFCGKRGGLCPPPASLLKKAGPKTFFVYAAEGFLRTAQIGGMAASTRADTPARTEASPGPPPHTPGTPDRKCSR